MRPKPYPLGLIVFLAILFVGCQAQRASLPAATNEPVHAPVTIPPVISSATKLAASPLPATRTIPARGESGASTHTPDLQRTPTATDTPTPTPDLPIPEVRLLGQIGGVYSAWQDNILGITFEIPLSWGKIEAEWDPSYRNITTVSIEVLCVDQKGLLAEITSSIAAAEANIRNARVSTTADKKAMNVFDIEVIDLDHLNSVTRSIERIKGVLNVNRIRF